MMGNEYWDYYDQLPAVNLDFLIALFIGYIIRKRISEAKPPMDTLSQKVQFVHDLYYYNSRPFLQRIYPDGTVQMEQTVIQMAKVCGIDLNVAKYAVVYQLLSMYGEILERKDKSAEVAEWMKNYYAQLGLDFETALAAVMFVRGEDVVCSETPTVQTVVGEIPTVIEEEPAVVEEEPAVVEEEPAVVEEEPAVVEEEPAVVEEATVVVEEKLAEAEDEMNFCPECGRKLPSNCVFCPACGRKVRRCVEVEQAERPRFCTNCGETIPEGYQFCGGCGTKRFTVIEKRSE